MTEYKSKVYFLVFLLCSAFVGLISYQFNLLCLSQHYDRFSQMSQSIYDGTISLRVFQQRILPSIVEKSISHVTGGDINYATMINHKMMFILISSVFFIYSRACAKFDNISSMLLTILFSMANVFIIDAGFWLYSFDLYNEFLLLCFFTILFSDLNLPAKTVSITALIIPWMFVFEEVIFVPILIALLINARRIRNLEIVSMIKDYRNYALVFLAFLMMIVTNIMRSSFAKIADTPHPDTILGQWIMVRPNANTILDEFRAFRHLGHTLKDGFYWDQGGGVFLVLLFFFFAIIKKYNCKSDRDIGMIILISFIALIIFVFAHLEEPNTMLPLSASIFVFFLNKLPRQQETNPCNRSSI